MSEIFLKQFLPNGDQQATNDVVAIEDMSDLEQLSYDQIFTKPTNYSDACSGAKINPNHRDFALRNSDSQNSSFIVVAQASNDSNSQKFRSANLQMDVSDNSLVCPMLFINLNALNPRKVKNSPLGQYKIRKFDKDFALIEFENLVFPQSIVVSEKAELLTSLYNTGNLKETGKSFIGQFDKQTKRPIFNKEYEYNGKLYVPCRASSARDVLVGQNPTYSQKGDEFLYWFYVEPISWRIRNYSSLPSWLNPDGDGSHKGILLRSNYGIISGIPFAVVKDTTYPKHSNDYQISFLRAYLNGYNSRDEIPDEILRDIDFDNLRLFNLKDHNFLDEAFKGEKTLIIENTVSNSSSAKKGYNIKIDNTPLSIQEQMQFYLNTGKTFMLHGPSGIGKTRRVQELDPQCVMLQLRNGILPEEIIGKTAFEDGISKWIEPTWYTKIKEVCENDKEHNHILFIDELTNVHANEQSLVYHIVLEHSIDGNIGKLPDNCVVIAAGNNPEESEAAYNMPEPLFRRFDAHIQLKPDIASWLEWGSELNNKNRPKIHPLIAEFVATYGERVFYSAYDPENPPKFAVDPRAWEQVSNIIYDNNNTLRFKLIEDKVGTDIATSLIDFASKNHLSVDDIVSGNYIQSDIPTSENEKFALTYYLRKAKPEQLKVVRNFIKTNFGGEKLATFDKLWAENSDENALFLSDLIEEENKASIHTDNNSQLS